MHHSSSIAQRLTVNRLIPCFVLLMLVMLASAPAAAQGGWQVYGGTSFLWARTTPQQQNGLSTVNEWGWQTDISQYPWRWFGGTLESSGFYGRPDVYDPSTGQTYGDLLNTRNYTLMFGPSFVYPRSKTIRPFGHVLFGGANGQYAYTSKGTLYLGGTTNNYSQWIFAWALGGGADVRINDLLAIRGQVDWLPTTFHNFYNDRQNNVRVSVGLVFRFGGAAPKTGEIHSPEPTPATSAAARPVNLPVKQNAGAASPDAPALAERANAPAAPSASTQALVSPETAISVAVQHSANGSNALQPGGAAEHAEAAPPVPAPAAPPMAMVEFWSNPSGADVEVDGQYVGSTYSTISIPPGEHTIKISKENYAPWQRTILVTSGSVRVAAYLEQVKATVTFH